MKKSKQNDHLKKAKNHIAKMIDLVKSMSEYGEQDELIQNSVGRVKKFITKNVDVLGTDYVIDAGVEVNSIWKEYDSRRHHQKVGSDNT